MGTYDGGQAGVDSSTWNKSVASRKNGEPQPAPAPTKQTADGVQRDVTPDPYTTDNPHMKRNFGRTT